MDSKGVEKVESTRLGDELDVDREGKERESHWAWAEEDKWFWHKQLDG